MWMVRREFSGRTSDINTRKRKLYRTIHHSKSAAWASINPDYKYEKCMKGLLENGWLVVKVKVVYENEVPQNQEGE